MIATMALTKRIVQLSLKLHPVLKAMFVQWVNFHVNPASALIRARFATVSTIAPTDQTKVLLVLSTSASWQTDRCANRNVPT